MSRAVLAFAALLATLAVLAFGIATFAKAYVEAIALRQNGQNSRTTDKEDTKRSMWQMFGDVAKTGLGVGMSMVGL